MLLAIQVNLLLGTIAAMLRVVSVPGMIAGAILGTVVWEQAGKGGYLPFLACAVGVAIMRWLLKPVGRLGSAPVGRLGADGRDAPVGRLRRAIGTSLPDVLAYCLMPSAFAVFWNALPDPSLCRVAVVAGFAAALAAIAGNWSRPAPDGDAASVVSKPASAAAMLGPVVRGLAGGSLIALVGLAARAIGFWQVWIVILAAGIGLAAGNAARFAFLRLVPNGPHSPLLRYADSLGGLVATSAACVCGFAAAWLARS